MPRVKISEYTAKKMLAGARLPETGRFVVKVDQGVKKRFLQGLVKVDVSREEAEGIIEGWKKLGYTNFLIEPYLVHEASEERYLSLERVRGGIRVLCAQEGGVKIEEHPEGVQKFLIEDENTPSSSPFVRGRIRDIAEMTQIPEKFLAHVLEIFEKNFFAFVEINPLVVRGDDVYLLDAAVLVDSAGAFFVKDSWQTDPLPLPLRKGEGSMRGRIYEERVEALAKTTPASLKLLVLNPDGALFFLLSGGGGSIVIADEAALAGAQGLIGNYGEYSGGPSRAETHLYAREVIALMLGSKAPKKALVIAGVVANFTDVATTFEVIIDALSEKIEELQVAGVKVFVRRGGPNEVVGLAKMRDFLAAHNLLGSVHGSEAVITQAVGEAVEFLKA